MNEKKSIELLDFGEEKKDLYLESMKLINNEIDQKQFIKDQMYYSMVRAIYMQEFKKLEADESLFSNNMYVATINPNLISVYLNSAIDVYQKLRDLNKYIGYSFKPFDDKLAYYVATQYINYFNQRGMFEHENAITFYDKMLPNIKEYKHHPFKRVNSDTYGVEEINGIHVYINDLIYKSKKNNKQICHRLNIPLENLLKIRLGEVEYTKDLLYMLFLGLQLSKHEIIEFIDKSFTLNDYERFGGFDSQRDKAILRFINDINIFKSVDDAGNNVVDIINNLLIENKYDPLNTNIITKSNSDSNVKTILLIGGFGFIGSECIDFFKNNNDGINYNICVLARNIPKNLPENIICYQGDITNGLVYERILSENNIDYIINLAAISTISKGDELFEETLMINVQAPNALHSTILENRFPVKCVIFPSTIQVYSGMVDASDSCQEYSMISAARIQNDYAYSKFQAEENCLRYAKKGVPIIITRLCNIYGKQDTNYRLIPQILKCIDNDQPVNLYVDDTDERRSPMINLLYVEDLMLAFKRIFEKMEENSIKYDNNNYEKIIVNIANSTEYSIREVVEKMYELCGKELNVNLVKKPISYSRPIDVQKAKDEFGFEAIYSLDEGLSRVVGPRKINSSEMILKRKVN